MNQVIGWNGTKWVASALSQENITGALWFTNPAAASSISNAFDVAVTSNGVSTTISSNRIYSGTNYLDKLRVGGAAETTDAVNVTGNILASGNVTATGQLRSSLSTVVNANYGFIVGGSLNGYPGFYRAGSSGSGASSYRLVGADGVGTTTNNFYVSGSGTFTNSVQSYGDITDTQNGVSTVISSNTVTTATLTGNVGATNLLTVSGDLTVSNTNRVGKLRVGGAAESSYAVDVTGGIRASAASFFSASAQVSGILYLSTGAYFVNSWSILGGTSNRVTFKNYTSTVPADLDAGNAFLSGSITATNGHASFASAATIAITATGWTNSYAVNAIVDFHASLADLNWYIKNSAGTGVYTNTTGLAAHATAILQPGGALVITAGTSPAGTARQF